MQIVRAQLGTRIYQNFGSTLYPCVTVPHVEMWRLSGCLAAVVSFISIGILLFLTSCTRRLRLGKLMESVTGLHLRLYVILYRAWYKKRIG